VFGDYESCGFELEFDQRGLESRKLEIEFVYLIGCAHDMAVN